MLKSASDPSAIIQDCPELATPETLSRCLATIQSMHVGQDPVKVSDPISQLVQQHNWLPTNVVFSGMFAP